MYTFHSQTTYVSGNLICPGFQHSKRLLYHPTVTAYGFRQLAWPVLDFAVVHVDFDFSLVDFVVFDF